MMNRNKMNRVIFVFALLIFLLPTGMVGANNIGRTSIKAKLVGNYTLQQKNEIIDVLKSRLKSYADKEAIVNIENDSVFITLNIEIDSMICVDLLTKKGEFIITELYSSEDIHHILLKINDLLKTNQFKDIREQIDAESSMDGDGESFENQPLFRILKPNKPNSPYDRIVAHAMKKDSDLIAAIFNNELIKKHLPLDSHIAWFSEPEWSSSYYALFLVKGSPVITNRAIKAAKANVNDYGGQIVNIALKEEYHKAWEDLTAANIGKPLSIMIDGVVVTAPLVYDVITGGKMSISGGLYFFKIKALAAILNNNLLNATIEIVGVEYEYPPIHYLLKLLKKLK